MRTRKTHIYIALCNRVIRSFLPTLRTHMGSIVNAEASLASSQDAIDMGVGISSCTILLYSHLSDPPVLIPFKSLPARFCGSCATKLTPTFCVLLRIQKNGSLHHQPIDTSCPKHCLLACSHASSLPRRAERPRSAPQSRQGTPRPHWRRPHRCRCTCGARTAGQPSAAPRR